MDTDSSFMATPKKDEEAPKSSFGGGSGFTLGSTFKGDGTAANDAPKPSGNAPGSLFGGGFGNMLEEVQKEPGTPQTKDADMDEEDDSAPAEVTKAPPTEDTTTTPVAKPVSPKFRFPSVPPTTGGLFGTQAQSKTTPAAVQNSQPTSFGFGKPTPIPTPITTTPKDTPKRSSQSPLPSIETSPKVKTEPQSDEDDISPLNEAEAAPPEGYESPDTPTASKTPEPPLPPESTSKTTFAPGDSSNSSKSSDDAPLPPDFLPAKSKLKEVEPAPEEQPALPSGDEDQDSEEEEEEEERGEEVDGEEEGYERSEEEGEERGSEEDRRPFDDEGSGVDVAQELSPTTDQSPKLTPGSSFGGPMEKSPPGGLFSRTTRPQQGQKGRSLFGEVGKTSAPYLPPPSKLQQSPRSPSPVRSRALGDSLRPDNARSVSAPGPFKALDNRKLALSQLAVPSKPQPSAQDVRKQERERLAALQAQRAAEEEQDLSDREDERVREELATDVEPTKTLDPFLAHQDYIGDIDKPGIPGQIEKVYRDINSMIDTLGLNARSLKAFVKGHEQLYKQNGRERTDLENDDWCLIEIAELERNEGDVATQLENGKIQDVPQTFNECRDLRRGVATLRARASDIARVIDAKSDPEKIESARSAPLRLDHAIQQQELRKKVTRFQKLLAEAEENITMLRAKLASCETANGKGPPLKKPTVEAVTNTIMKMTSIVEKKCLDIEVLENQMRNLRFSSVASQNSREGSPFTPISAKGKRVSRLGASALQNGHSYSPELSRGTRVSPRKAIEDFTPEEVQICREKAQRRQEVNDIIKEAFSKHGPRIRTLD
jgi:nucleoporin NUP159